MNKEKIINKPITVVRQEFIDSLRDTINNSGLPPFILEPILRDVYFEVQEVVRRQYEFDKMSYEQELLKTKKESE